MEKADSDLADGMEPGKLSRVGGKTTCPGDHYTQKSKDETFHKEFGVYPK